MSERTPARGASTEASRSPGERAPGGTIATTVRLDPVMTGGMKAVLVSAGSGSGFATATAAAAALAGRVGNGIRNPLEVIPGLPSGGITKLPVLAPGPVEADTARGCDGITNISEDDTLARGGSHAPRTLCSPCAPCPGSAALPDMLADADAPVGASSARGAPSIGQKPWATEYTVPHAGQRFMTAPA